MAIQDDLTISPIKQCQGRCGLERPCTEEFFRPSKETKDGFRNECRECEKDTAATPNGRSQGAAHQAAYRARKALQKAAEADPELAARIAAADDRPPPGMKRCSGDCGEVKPLNKEYFHRRESSKDGFRSDCRECVRKRQEKYNRTEERKQARYERESALRQTDPEWREKQNAPVRDWRDQQIPERPRNYEAQPHVKVRKAKEHRAWAQTHPELKKSHEHKRRARKRGAEGSYSPSDLIRIMGEQQGICFYCNDSITKSYTIDHFIPLARGGSNWPDNIKLACKPCNSQKHDKLPSEFTPKVKRY